MLRKKAGNLLKALKNSKNAEMNKEIEDGYNIVKLDGKFLIVKDSDVDQAVELTGVTDAYEFQRMTKIVTKTTMFQS